jgi:hypothetical protein
VVAPEVVVLVVLLEVVLQRARKVALVGLVLAVEADRKLVQVLGAEEEEAVVEAHKLVQALGVEEAVEVEEAHKLVQAVVEEAHKLVLVPGVVEAAVVVVEEDRKLVQGVAVEVVEAALVVRILSSEDRMVLSRWVAHTVTSPAPVRRTTITASVEMNKVNVSLLLIRRFGRTNL